jgi:hypothetical protein
MRAIAVINQKGGNNGAEDYESLARNFLRVECGYGKT